MPTVSGSSRRRLASCMASTITSGACNHTSPSTPDLHRRVKRGDRRPRSGLTLSLFRIFPKLSHLKQTNLNSKGKSMGHLTIVKSERADGESAGCTSEKYLSSASSNQRSRHWSWFASCGPEATPLLPTHPWNARASSESRPCSARMGPSSTLHDGSLID